MKYKAKMMIVAVLSFLLKPMNRCVSIYGCSYFVYFTVVRLSLFYCCDCTFFSILSLKWQNNAINLMTALFKQIIFCWHSLSNSLSVHNDFSFNFLFGSALATIKNTIINVNSKQNFNNVIYFFERENHFFYFLFITEPNCFLSILIDFKLKSINFHMLKKNKKQILSEHKNITYLDFRLTYTDWPVSDLVSIKQIYCKETNIFRIRIYALLELNAVIYIWNWFLNKCSKCNP